MDNWLKSFKFGQCNSYGKKLALCLDFILILILYGYGKLVGWFQGETGCKESLFYMFMYSLLFRQASSMHKPFPPKNVW